MSTQSFMFYIVHISVLVGSTMAATSHLPFSSVKTSRFSWEDEMSVYSSRQSNTCRKRSQIHLMNATRKEQKKKTVKPRKTAPASGAFCFHQRQKISKLISLRILRIKAAVSANLR